MNLDSDCTAGQRCILLCCGLINRRLINTFWSICWLFRSLSCLQMGCIYVWQLPSILFLQWTTCVVLFSNRKRMCGRRVPICGIGRKESAGRGIAFHPTVSGTSPNTVGRGSALSLPNTPATIFDEHSFTEHVHSCTHTLESIQSSHDNHEQLKVAALSMKAEMCKFRNGSNTGTPSSNQIEPLIK